ncbi:MAG: VacJ family lipoprotein [Pseudomonadota bacterium]
MKKTANILILSCIFMFLLGASVHSADIPAVKASPSDDEGYMDEAEPRVIVADPLSGLNRAVFEFNDKLYFWAMKPIAQGYKAVVPTPVRQGILNFFHNLKAPVRIANCFLQGKMGAMANEMGRFVYNTSFGILGFWDPAKDYPHLNPPEEDFGQTLGYFGIGNGIYLVLPFLGPSTLRDTAGMGGDYFLSPTAYIDPAAVGWSMKGEESVNDLSFRIGQYEELKDAAIEPYESFKDGYLQYRNKKINQ